MRSKKARAGARRVPRARPTTLAGLASAPDVEVHPLRMLLLRKGVSLAEGAALLGWSLRKVMLVVNDWRRPRDADRIAKALGRDVEDVFPEAAAS